MTSFGVPPSPPFTVGSSQFLKMTLSLETTTVENTVGAMFLGVIFSTFLFGITTLQAYIYYQRFPADFTLHKYSVALLWILDIIHLAFIIHASYTYTVLGFGNVLGIVRVVWSVRAQVVINVIVALFVQCLYAYRVWILRGYHHGYLGHTVMAAVTVGFAVGIICIVKVFTVNTFLELENVKWAIYAAFATATGVDFLITGTMCWYLLKSKGTDMRLNNRVARLMQFTTGSGLLTAACSLAALFCYILIPYTFVFLALEFVLVQLYVGSFLVMLNARERPIDASELDGFRLHVPMHDPSISSPTTINRDKMTAPWADIDI